MLYAFRSGFLALAVASGLVACAPAALEITRGPSAFARAEVVPVRGFLVGRFDGPLGPELRSRVITALEARGFTVQDAQANPSSNSSDFAVSGVVNAERAVVSSGSVSPVTGLGFVTTNEYWNVSGAIVRVASRRDGQTARVLELRADARLTVQETASLIADGVQREFRPAR